MENLRQKLQQLFEKPVWSAEDRKWLLEYLEQNNSTDLQQLMQQLFTLDLDSTGRPRDEKSLKILANIRQVMDANARNSKTISLFSRYKTSFAAAAMFLVMLGAGTVYYFTNNTTGDRFSAGLNIDPANDLPPGGKKALLTLADGGRIVLDTASNGMLTRQAGAMIIKSGNGSIEYLAEGNLSEKTDFNTISTPVGGQYELTLSDGSKVWLNSASSIRFPTTFKGTKRIVSINGEAYFEVNPLQSGFPGKKAGQKNIPFIVEVAGKGRIEVLGTHFNVNAYTNENTITTTLLEGSIKLSNAVTSSKISGEPVLLSPGQQGLLATNGEISVNSKVNMEKVVAWKNGYFLFSSSSIQEVMNQIARWYDIEIIYEGKISDRKFGGKIQMDLNLSETLKILTRNNLQFRIEGKKLFVVS
ncbi:MAG: FecR family protein [Prolixibacteraceae bacterium]